MRAHTLVYYPDDPDGSLRHVDLLEGVPVKAGLGVRTLGTGRGDWLNIYDTRYGRHARTAARQGAVDWMRACVPVLHAAGYYERARHENFCLGRAIFDQALHRMELVLHHLLLLERFLSIQRPGALSTWRADELPQDLREAIAAFAAARGVELRTIAAPPLAHREEKAAPIVGCHPFQGQIGLEIAALRPGASLGFGDRRTQWGYADFDRSRLPISIPVEDASAGVAVVIEVLYAYADKGGAEIRVATDRHEALIGITADGVVDLSSVPPRRLLPPPGPTSLRLSIVLSDGTAWVGQLGGSAKQLDLRRRSRGATSGVHIDCRDSLGPLLRLRDITVYGHLNPVAVDAWRRGLADTVAIAPGSTPGSIGPSARWSIGTVMPSTGHLVASWPEIGDHSAPIHFDGYAFALERIGLRPLELLLGTPWTLGRSPQPSRDRALLIDAVTLPSEVKDSAARSGRAAEAAIIDIAGTAPLAPAPDLGGPLAGLDLVPILRRALAEGARLCSWYVEQYEKARLALAERPVRTMMGPRLDSGFLPHAAAASSLGIRTVALEISFMIHEHQRLHRLAGVEETTDLIAYWGTSAREHLQERGLDGDRLHVSGLCSLDYYSALRSLRARATFDPRAYWASLGVPDVEPPVILFAAHFGGRQAIYDIDAYHLTLETVLRVLAETQRGTLVVKALTTDDPTTIGRIGGLHDGARLRLISPFHPFQNAHYLFGSDLVISAPTTLLAEAVTMGRPSATLDLSHHENWYPISSRQLADLGRIAPVVDDESALAKLIRELLDGRLVWRAPPPGAMERLFGAIDGRTVRRLVDHLRSLGIPVG
jgi:hypothetical protein